MADDQKLNEIQGWKLAELVHEIRPDWGVKGTHDMIGAAVAAGLGNHIETCIAAIRAAGEPTNDSPGVIPLPGKHWNVERTLATTKAELKAAKDKLAGKYTAPDTNDPPCTDHPGQHFSTCTECAAIKTPMPADFRTRAGLPPKSARKPTRRRTTPEPATTPTDTTEATERHTP